MPLPVSEVSDAERAAMLQFIERRLGVLEQLEHERKALLMLRQLYRGDGPADVGQQQTEVPLANTGQPTLASDDGASRTKPKNLPPNTAKPGGTTESIVRIARQFPGLSAKELIDRVEAVVNTDATDKRRTISSTLGTMVKRGTMMKRSGQFFLPPGSSNGNGQGRQPLAGASNLFDSP